MLPAFRGVGTKLGIVGSWCRSSLNIFANDDALAELCLILSWLHYKKSCDP